MHALALFSLFKVEDILYRTDDMQDSQVMIAVILGNQNGQRTVGVAFVDVVLKQIGTLQIPDNDQLSNIESVFYQVCVCTAVSNFPTSGRSKGMLLPPL